ncbi:MAG: IS66 family transposase [Planctomycetales bacterium]|nr:IS66 family transposase [Planctomycetales bacterium]
MSCLPSPLPHDTTSCHALIEQLAADLSAAHRRNTELELSHQLHCDELNAELSRHKKLIAELEQTVENLAADNQLLKRSLFGSRRERYTEDDPAQLLLFDAASLQPEQAAEPETEPLSPPPQKRTSKGRQPRVFPEFLQRERQEHLLDDAEIPEEMRDNPQVRRFFKKVSEQIEVIPLQLKVVEHYQEVLALDRAHETTQIITATRPPTLIQSFAGVSLLSHLAVCRFADHLPYYRIEEILGRAGVFISRSTQLRWMRGLALGVAPLVELMWQRVLLSQIIAMDETPVKELSGVGAARTGYLWAGVGDAQHPYDCFFYSSDRRAINPQDLLQGYRGYLLTDAYVGYERLGQLQPEIISASCWAHSRRKFDECHLLGPTDKTRTVLGYIRQLFDLEDVFRPYSDEQRLAARLAQSQPIVESLQKWLEDEQLRQLPKSKLRGAINYMLNRWDSFTRFLESGAIPLDNNAAERAVKFPILGRKAWLFVGNHQAGETAATLFTLTKTCNRHRIEPFAYLQDVFARLPTMTPEELPALLPDRWILEHPEHLIDQRVQEALDRAQRKREQRAERRQARGAA